MTTPATWATFAEALAYYQAGLDGVGYVFSEDDPFCGVDLDDCLDLGTGQLTEEAAAIVADLNTYTEVSPSGTGVKLFCRASLPSGRHRKDCIEIYDSRRYFCMTGARLDGSPTKCAARQAAVEKLHARLFGQTPRGGAARKSSTTPDWADNKIIELASNAANGAKFRRLWSGDTTEYGGDESRADEALCCLLAFWANKDQDQIDRLFRQSGLYRDKWNRQNYRDRTITSAIEKCTETYQGGCRARGVEKEAKTGATNDKQKKERKPIFRCLQGIEPKEVDWVWESHIPRGALTLLIGDPGEGKSMVSADLATRVSQGWKMPPGGGPDPDRAPAGVLILAAEDSLEHTIVPRLIAAGADTGRVFTFDTVLEANGEESPVSCLYDLATAEPLIVEHKIELVIIDPVLSYCGNHDSHKDAEVRQALAPIVAMAGRTGAAIIGIMHLNKATDRSPKHRVQASTAFIAMARAAFAIGPDPSNPRVRVFAPLKANLGPQPPALTFTIESRGQAGAVAWGEETDLDAAAILAGPAKGGRRGETSKVDQCAAFIELALAHGPVGGSLLRQRCRNAGFSDYAVREAKKMLGVVSGPDQFQGDWVSQLPVNAEGDTAIF